MPFSAYLIVCPFVFLAGFVDAIGGGGGLIALPAYILAGVPMHAATATNKLSSSMGTAISTFRLCRKSKIDLKLIVPAVFLALTGAAVGTKLSLMVDEKILKQLLLVVLPVTAFFVLKKNAFAEEKGVEAGRKRTLLVSWIAAVIIGMYDGFYGPGTGTFYIIVFMSFAHMKAMDAAVNTKILNLTSNVTALIVFLLHGECNIPLGLAASVFSIAGHYLGSGMVLKNGSKVIRPIIIVVLCLLFVKVVTEL